MNHALSVQFLFGFLMSKFPVHKYSLFLFLYDDFSVCLKSGMFCCDAPASPKGEP